VLLAPLAGETVPRETRAVGGVYPHAVDAAAAERLWALSEELTGAHLPA
jgi:hypothetical protein